jgi:hypothetical protein
VSALNALLRPTFDLLLRPLSGLPPMVGLVLVSLVAAVLMLLVFKATSDQPKLQAVKRQIHACLFEIRLFNDDLLAILRAQVEILRHNLRYLGLSLVPMLFMIVPLLLVIAQLQFHYGYEGLRPGQDFLVEVQLRGPDDGSRPPASLEAPVGLVVETPAVFIPSQRELAWRLRAMEWGDHQLLVRVDGQEYAKTVQVSADVERRSPVRLAAGFLNDLLYPAEGSLPKGSPVASISVQYPEATVSLLGWRVHWMVAFFVLSIVFAFALRGRFGVVL